LVKDKFSRLLSCQWLDDEVLNAYGALPEQRIKKTLATNPSAPKQFSLNTFFYHRLWHRGHYSYQMVKRWIKMVEVFSKKPHFYYYQLRRLSLGLDG